MKNRIFKISIAVLLIAVMALSLFSCGNKVSNTDGKWGDFAWTFKDGVLSVNGSGALPTVESSAKVGWASVREGVKEVVFYGNVTSISAYAFYGMSALTRVTFPSNAEISSIGNAAFAFCTSLKSFNIPETVVTIGPSAFEGCVALEGIKLPEKTTSIGARAFAFCRSLKSVVGSGNISAIGDWTFKDCSALETVVLRSTFDMSKISSNAFEGAKIGADKITVSDAQDNTVTITMVCVDEAGKPIPGYESKTETRKFGEPYNLVAPTNIAGYSVDGEQNASGTAYSSQTITFKYKKISETTAPADTTDTETANPEEKKSSTSTIIALVIFGVVIVGICIGAFLLIRSDKKQKKNGMTVRKNDGDNKNGKKNKRK